MLHVTSMNNFWFIIELMFTWLNIIGSNVEAD